MQVIVPNDMIHGFSLYSPRKSCVPIVFGTKLAQELNTNRYLNLRSMAYP
jgi:hypothetical protein